jgi:transcriptional regulator with XRE-family HTH domain
MYAVPRPVNTTTRPGQLRNLLNVSVEEFAEIAGLSTHMIRSIESGREPLSRQAAEGISFGTGVDTEWLLGQGRSHLPTTLDLNSGEHIPYTREHYRQRSTPRNPGEPLNPFLNDVCLVRCRRLMAFLRAAERKGKAPAALYLFKRFIDDGVEKLESFPSEQKRMRQMIEEEFARECELAAERERKQRWIERRALTGPQAEQPPRQQSRKKRA